MREPDQFDQFYKDVRTRLLLLTYCLTGDLASSRAAVRDAFVVAWHHWRKVSRLDDPEAWVRERACRHAQRRHTAKLWHREKGLDPEVKATLDALGRLSFTQRRILLLTELTSSSLTSLAREVGLPRTEAERQLQTAVSTFTLHREVGTTQVRTVLEAVRPHVDDTRWPRSTILRRAGATRRRTHTFIGVATTAAALVVTGTLVTDADGVRPTLPGERAEGPATFAAQPPEPVQLPEESLLDLPTVTGLSGTAAWTEGTTSDNSSGDGIVVTCQDARYAGPRQPDAALVRTFESAGTKQLPATQVVQVAQAADNERVANRSYDSAVRWFADCRTERAQLVATYDLPGVGDEATLLELRTWTEPNRTVLAGVARSGQFTTATTSSTPGDKGPSPEVVAQLLGAGVDELCALPEGGACSTDTSPVPTDPVPVAPAPGMLAEVDLPPLHGVEQPWVGTEPRRALQNAAATGCDATSFNRRGISNIVTRTFVAPGAKLPAQFGLTETVGTMPKAKAKAFVDDVRTRMARCEDKQMGTEVTRLRNVRRGDTDLSVWHVTTEVSDEKSISFLMGVAREGTAVAQVGFVPVKGASISEKEFEAVVRRAQDRLAKMPPPRSG